MIIRKFQGVSQEINVAFPKLQKEEEPSPSKNRTLTSSAPVDNRAFSSPVTTTKLLYTHLNMIAA